MSFKKYEKNLDVENDLSHMHEKINLKHFVFLATKK
jgi:hypothetical protein